ncbi:hypothetical protein EBZ39_03475 [bacterium]|nr:hypothetical protein [bacterium]
MPKYRMYNNPEQFGAKLQKPPAKTIRYLGLDFGSNCGVAIYDHEKGSKLLKDRLQLFQWDLSPQGLESNVARYVRLRAFLNVVKPDVIGYEDVKYSPPKEFFAGKKFGIPAVLARVSKASEVLGGMKITAAAWAEEAELIARGYGISTIKKFATGSGKSNKEDMIAAANRFFGSAFDAARYKSTGIDNVVDAAFVLIMLIKEIQAGIDNAKQK